MIELLLILIVASALLWLWLSGHWFVRIMATLALWPAFVVLFDPMLYRAPGDPGNTPLALFWLALCGGLAWCLASLPTWCRRQSWRFQRRPNYQLTLRR